MFLVFFSDWFTAGLLWFEPSTKFVFKHTHTQTCDWQSTKHVFQPSKHLLFSTKLCLSPPVWSCLGHGRFMIQFCASIMKSCWCQAQEQCCYHKTGGANHYSTCPISQELEDQFEQEVEKEAAEICRGWGNMEQILTERWKIGFFFGGMIDELQFF